MDFFSNKDAKSISIISRPHIFSHSFPQLFYVVDCDRIIDKYCKDQFRLRSNTGMDPGPRSPNNEFVECGKKS